MANELTISLLGALAVALIGGIGWLIKRGVTGERRKEAASELTAVLDLLHKLKASGMTMDEAKRLAAEFGKGKMSVPLDQQDAVGEVKGLEDEPDQYGTTMAMKMRLGAQLDAVNAQLKQTLVDLELLLDENEERLLERAQADWEKHAQSEATLSSSSMSGGTLEGVLFMAELIQQAEKRIEAVKEQTRQRKFMR